MINTDDYIPPSTTATQDPLLSSYGASQRLNDLYAEAHSARLAQQFRLAHPERSLRYRAAAGLRRLADRVAPTAGSAASTSAASTPRTRPRVARP